MSPDPVITADDVVILIPAFNEEDCIAGVVAEVRAAGFTRIVVVDDGSTDRTATVAREAGARVLALPINLGVGGALRAGFRYAINNDVHCVVQVDADGQHVADHIDELLERLHRDGLDMVIGSRFAADGSHHMSWLRRRCINVMARRITRVTDTALTDPTSGFRAIRSPLLDAFAGDFPHHYLGDTFEALYVAARRGYRIGEVPVAMRERQGGRPSADLLASARFLLRAFTVVLTGTMFDLPQRRA